MFAVGITVVCAGALIIVIGIARVPATIIADLITGFVCTVILKQPGEISSQQGNWKIAKIGAWIMAVGAVIVIISLFL